MPFLSLPCLFLPLSAPLLFVFRRRALLTLVLLGMPGREVLTSGGFFRRNLHFGEDSRLVFRVYYVPFLSFEVRGLRFRQ